MSEGITALKTSRAGTATKRGAALRLTTVGEPLWSDTITEFIAYRNATGAQSTSTVYADLLKILREWAERENIALVDFRARDLDRYLGWRKTQPSKVDPSKMISDNTRRKEAIAARLFFRFCYQRGLLESDLLKDYVLPRGNRSLPGVPTEKEILRLIASIKRHWDPNRNPIVRFIPAKRRNFYATRNVAIVIGLAQTGARIGELLSLRMEDYRPKDRVVVYRDTKTDEDREVPIKQEWIDVVDAYLKHRPRMAASKTLFVNDYGEQITERVWATAFRRMKEYCDECQHCRGTGHADTLGRSMLSKSGRRRRKANPNTPTCAACGGTGTVPNPLGKWSSHGLRHYFVTRMCEHGVDVAQKLAGHRSVSTTMIYNHVSRDRIRSAYDAADVLPLENDEPPIMVNKRSQANKKRRLV